VRGMASAPTTAASSGLGFIAFMKAEVFLGDSEAVMAVLF